MKFFLFFLTLLSSQIFSNEKCPDILKGVWTSSNTLTADYLSKYTVLDETSVEMWRQFFGNMSIEYKDETFSTYSRPFSVKTTSGKVHHSEGWSKDTKKIEYIASSGNQVVTFNPEENEYSILNFIDNNSYWLWVSEKNTGFPFKEFFEKQAPLTKPK